MTVEFKEVPNTPQVTTHVAGIQYIRDTRMQITQNKFNFKKFRDRNTQWYNYKRGPVYYFSSW